MKTKTVSYTINHPIDDVFARVTAAINLSLSERSESLNTSYAQPVGTEFQYRETAFGQDVAYTAQITQFQKPTLMEFKLTERDITTTVQVHFQTLIEGSTEVLYEISLTGANIIQRFFKRNHIAAWLRRFDEQIHFATKILGKR